MWHFNQMLRFLQKGFFFSLSLKNGIGPKKSQNFRCRKCSKIIYLSLSMVTASPSLLSVMRGEGGGGASECISLDLLQR